MRAYQWIPVPRSIIRGFEGGQLTAGEFCLYVWLSLKKGMTKIYLRDASKQLGYSAEQLGRFAERLAGKKLLSMKRKDETINGKKCTYYRYYLKAQSDYFQLTYRDFDFLIGLGTTELAIGTSLMESHGSSEYWETSGRKLATKWNLDHKTVLKTVNNLESSNFLHREKKGKGFTLTVCPRFVSYSWVVSNGSKHYVSSFNAGVMQIGAS